MSYIWQPAYVSKFKCDGKRCNSKCCKGWLITIDNNSYEKYKTIKNIEKRERILSSIQCGVDKYNIKLDDKLRCPLLCNDNLCYIQRNFGEEYLSTTCTTYPRHLHVLDNRPIHLLSLTCPVVLEEAIFSHEGMKLEKHYNIRNNMAWKMTYKIRKNWFRINNSYKIEENIVIGSVRILQNEKYKWEERLILLGLFLDRAEEIILSKKSPNELSSLVEVYLSEDFRQQAELFFMTYEYDNKNGRKIIQEIFSLPEMFIAGDVLRTKECIDRCIAEYDELHNKVFQEWGYAIENYFIQEFLYGKYPFKMGNGLMNNYFTFLLLYKEFEYNLYKIVLETGNISKNNMIALIDFFVRNTDHGNKCIKTIEKLSLQYSADPLRFMQSIIYRPIESY